MNGYQRRLIAAGTSVAVLVIADQFLKRLVATKEISISLLSGRIAIKAWENEIGVVVAAGVLVAIAYLLSREYNTAIKSGLVLIAAGGISNAGDQILYGAVLDIIQINHIALNVADILIITGAVIIVMSAYLSKKEPGVLR